MGKFNIGDRVWISPLANEPFESPFVGKKCEVIGKPGNISYIVTPLGMPDVMPKLFMENELIKDEMKSKYDLGDIVSFKCLNSFYEGTIENFSWNNAMDCFVYKIKVPSSADIKYIKEDYILGKIANPIVATYNEFVDKAVSGTHSDNKTLNIKIAKKQIKLNFKN